MGGRSFQQAYRSWLDALERLTGTVAEAQAFQDRRFGYAHRLRRELLDDPRVGRTPLLYGVELGGAGWIYVGQTLNGRRRLSDLPIGESHHLANTYPPELWHRVVILFWPLLPAAPPEPAPALGVGLELLLQRHVRPLQNSRRKGPGGTWLSVDFDLRAEAVSDASITALWPAVRATWDELATSEEANAENPFGRVIFPHRVLE